jgi:hypothetical protein
VESQPPLRDTNFRENPLAEVGCITHRGRTSPKEWVLRSCKDQPSTRLRMTMMTNTL